MQKNCAGIEFPHGCFPLDPIDLTRDQSGLGAQLRCSCEECFTQRDFASILSRLTEN
jgi:hypothetical protein